MSIVYGTIRAAIFTGSLVMSGLVVSLVGLYYSHAQATMGVTPNTHIRVIKRTLFTSFLLLVIALISLGSLIDNSEPRWLLPGLFIGILFAGFLVIWTLYIAMEISFEVPGGDMQPVIVADEDEGKQ